MLTTMPPCSPIPQTYARKKITLLLHGQLLEKDAFKNKTKKQKHIFIGWKVWHRWPVCSNLDFLKYPQKRTTCKHLHEMHLGSGNMAAAHPHPGTVFDFPRQSGCRWSLSSGVPVCSLMATNSQVQWGRHTMASGSTEQRRGHGKERTLFF